MKRRASAPSRREWLFSVGLRVAAPGDVNPKVNAKHVVDGTVDGDLISAALEQAAHFLPGQAPLGAFVHHNTLHVLEELDFHDAVRRAHDLFGARAYMPDAWFREQLAAGRITEGDVNAVVQQRADCAAPVVSGVTEGDVVLASLLHDLAPRSVAEIEYMRDELTVDAQPTASADWELCVEITPLRSVDPAPTPLRDRDAILAATGIDSDALIHPVLIRLLGSYLDAGLAYWPMPDRDDGFYAAVRSLSMTRSSLPAAWMHGLGEAFAQQAEGGLTAVQVVGRRLEVLGIDREGVEAYLREQLLALPGWAGMVAHLEATPHHRLTDIPYSLVDYMAVRLTLEEFAVRAVADEELGYTGPCAGLRSFAWAQDSRAAPTNRVDADRLYRLVLAMHMPRARIGELVEADAGLLLSALDACDEPTRGAAWQEAYELHHRHQVLDALAHVAGKQNANEPTPPELQVVCCIDDREESLRRHVEEQSPRYETFGAAGFYGLAIEYQGLMAGHPAPLCPASMRPTHRILEVPDEGEDAEAWRRRWGMLSRTGFAGHVGSRTMLRGLGLSLAGVLEAGPMLLRTVAPRAAHRWRARVRGRVIRPPRTRLTAIRQPGSQPTAGLPVGYTIDEAVDALAGIFVGMGLTSRFAPLVVVLGHGSTSMNNPHEAAHECGACSGGKGGPNGRLFAELANLPKVRAGLKRRGVSIPESTWFIGGIHDTSDDAVDLDDLHRVPESHASHLATAVAALDRARTLDAHERCRRFHSVPLDIDPPGALRHVQGRSQFHGEPRPEYGHCTNAICLVGRRWLQRGVFLDRRAFLVSYDPTQDSDGSVLQRLLASVGPVGAGINLEYYFSRIDQDHYGSGTKLPHNVSGLVGVMNGHQGDLRTGLPYQMVDIHEPVRLLTVVEATPARLESIAQLEPSVGRLVTNRWIQLVAMDPTSMDLWEMTSAGPIRYTPQGPVSSHATSAAYYAGHRDNLRPVAIEAGVEAHG